MATKYMKTFFSESVRGPAIAHTCAIVCVCVSGIWENKQRKNLNNFIKKNASTGQVQVL